MKLVLPLVIVAAAVCLWIAGARIDKMKAEYATAAAIRELTIHVARHHGEWPSSPAELANKPTDEVWIDFSMSSDRILADPEILKEAVRPKSGSFQTYPHYERDLRSLLETIRKAKTEAGP